MPKRKRRQPTAESIARRDAVRAAKKAEADRLARLAAEDEARRQEERDEQLAPAIRRKPIMAGDGTILYHPRLERDGVSFIRSNPIAHLVARGIRRVEAGAQATITPAHERAAARLQGVWETAGVGISYGTANYGERASGTPQSGVIAAAILESAAIQRRASVEIAAAQTWLGALWPVVHAVALQGLVLTAWAETRGMERQAAMGYLAAALDRLVEFYRPAKPAPDPIRAVTVASSREVVDAGATS